MTGLRRRLGQLFGWPNGGEGVQGPVDGNPDQRVEWFKDHYEQAAGETIDFLGEAGVSVEGRVVADIGCGEGFTDLGIFRRVRPARLVGFDINPVSTEHLSEQARAAGVDGQLPEGLAFVLSEPERLPAGDDSFDLAFSWSAFEHVENPAALLKEIRRVLRDDGAFFLQLWPFYYSQHGSHLMRWYPEGFCQITESDQAIVERLGSDPDSQWSEMMIDNYLNSLNRVTVDELHADLREAGFAVRRLELISNTVQLPDGADEYPLSALGISGVKLLAVPCDPRGREPLPVGRGTRPTT